MSHHRPPYTTRERRILLRGASEARKGICRRLSEAGMTYAAESVRGYAQNIHAKLIASIGTPPSKHGAAIDALEMDIAHNFAARSHIRNDFPEVKAAARERIRSLVASLRLLREYEEER